jgi:hypothetical protein
MLIVLSTYFAYYVLHLNILHIILHILHIHTMFAYSAYWHIVPIIVHISHISHIIFQYNFLTGFKLSNNKMPEDMHQSQRTHDSPENDNAGPEIPVDQLVQPPTVLHLPPFYFHQFIHCLGCNETTMFKALEQTDAHVPDGRVCVHSECAGGGFRSHKTYFAYYTHLA